MLKDVKLQLQASLQKKKVQISLTHLQHHVALTRDAAPFSRVIVIFNSFIFNCLSPPTPKMRLKSEGTAKQHEFPYQCSVLVRDDALSLLPYKPWCWKHAQEPGNLRSYYWHIFEVVDALPHASWKHDTWQLCTMEVGKFKMLKFDTEFWLQTCALGRQPIPLAFQHKKILKK